MQDALLFFTADRGDHSHYYSIPVEDYERDLPMKRAAIYMPCHGYVAAGHIALQEPVTLVSEDALVRESITGDTNLAIFLRVAREQVYAMPLHAGTPVSAPGRSPLSALRIVDGEGDAAADDDGKEDDVKRNAEPMQWPRWLTRAVAALFIGVLLACGFTIAAIILGLLVRLARAV